MKEVQQEMVELQEQHENEDEAMRMHQQASPHRLCMCVYIWFARIGIPVDERCGPVVLLQAIYLELEATENEKERHKKAVSTLKFQIKLGTEKVLATQKALQNELAAAKGAVHQKEASEALLKQERVELLEAASSTKS